MTRACQQSQSERFAGAAARDRAAATISRREALLSFGTALGISLMAGGCAAYRFGSASLYPADIQTVYVPMFESNSFRRSLSEMLTEEVCKQIDLKTPYKVVGTPQADSVLTGKLISDTKRVIVEDQYDMPRNVEVNMAVEVRWVNRKGDLLNAASSVPLPQDLVTVSAPGMLIPEYGQSVATAQMQSIQTIAAKIVSLMESPW